MILETGKFGIKSMRNTNTKQTRDILMVYKNMPITGIISIDRDNTIDLGYNEQILMESKEAAVNLFKIINAILVKGEEAENVIDNMLDAAQNIFFQDAA